MRSGGKVRHGGHGPSLVRRVDSVQGGRGEGAQGTRSGCEEGSRPGTQKCSINAFSETVPAQHARATVTPAALTQGREGTWWGALGRVMSLIEVNASCTAP